MTAGFTSPLAVGRAAILWLGLICLAVLVIGGIFAPQVALRGWVIGFATAGSVPLGALAFLAIHGLTGGRWGDAARPSLVTAASAVPLLLLAWLPLALFSGATYPWASDPGAAGPDVARLYLNPELFALRGLIVLGLLAGFSVFVRRGPLASLAAGLCLVVYGSGMNISAFDWLLSIDPHFNASAFGVQIIMTQLVAALSMAILTAPIAPDDTVWGDLGALLLATLLGLIYLIFMTFLIDWYGDLPDHAAWYLVRLRHGWLALAITALLIGGFLPILALLWTAVRHRPATLRLVALVTLTGVEMEILWLVAPVSGAASVIAGLLATGAIGCFIISAPAHSLRGRCAAGALPMAADWKADEHE